MIELELLATLVLGLVVVCAIAALSVTDLLAAVIVFGAFSFSPRSSLSSMARWT